MFQPFARRAVGGAGLPIGLQNHNHGALLRTGDEVVRFVKAVDHPNLTFILDTGQWAGSRGASAPPAADLKNPSALESIRQTASLARHVRVLDRDRLPVRRVVVRLDFTGYRPHERYWLLLERGEVELCKTYDGLDEDLFVTADAEAFVKWHAGQLSWAEALRDSRIQLDGPSWLVRGFPTWNGRSMFAHIKLDTGAITGY